MKRIMLLILALILIAVPAAFAGTAFESWVPEGAAEASAVDVGGLKIITYDLPSGEQLTFTVDAATGEIRMLYGATESAPEGAPMDIDAAKSLLAEACPGALVISSAEEKGETSAVLRLNVISAEFCGYVRFDGDGICGRDLTFGAYMKDGRLNMQGAISVLGLLRPEAVVSEIELDDDDGLLLYEGNALLDGVEYEFEINANTGKLLQWDRD